MIEFKLLPHEANTRIDKLLRDHLESSSLSTIFSLLKKGKVKLNGKQCKGSDRGITGDTVKIFIDIKTAKPKDSSGRDKLFFEKNFKVIYEDNDIIVCNKQRGIAVHPGKSIKVGQSLIEMAQRYFTEKNENITPKLIHRLDSETTGIILIAKNEEALEYYLKALKNAEKYYIAICHGLFTKKSDIITAHLKRKSSASQGMVMEVVENGLKTHTEYEVIEQKSDYAIIKVKILTGRTHQIRVHMASIGHPIIGDNRYGDRELDKAFFTNEDFKKRLFLHAEELIIPGSRRKKRRFFCKSEF